MEYTTILYEKSEGIGTITLNRPKSMNALNSTLLSELGRVFLTEIAKDDEVKVVIVTGSDKFFAAGADITEIANLAAPTDAYKFLQDADIFRKLEDFDKPIIAVIRGLALGGGCELAMACDLRIAAENAVFGQPEIRIGVIPGGGGTQRLPRLIGVTKAKELLYTGDNIDAQEAYRLGLVNKIVPVESAMDEARKMASKIARQPGVALRATKLSVNGGMSMDMRSAMAYEARCFEILFSTEDQKEGMKAFVEKRKPEFKDR
ncbi:MAG: enoyl-CoA hydratase/isomerase family protein [Deltaproteobacteria bacterium]|nr:enoyl-CoA hydratase/isomerase family protein [Deltaproteobacteria bacterium]